MTDIDRPGLDGELIDLPPEPPHDHLVMADQDLYAWSDDTDDWCIQNGDWNFYHGWPEIARRRPITVYAPIKEYK